MIFVSFSFKKDMSKILLFIVKNANILLGDSYEQSFVKQEYRRLVLLCSFFGFNMDKKMVFYSIIDFFPRRELIKKRYDLLTLEEKNQYKMYIYSLPFMEDDIKDEIWEYLNDWLEDYEKLCKKYYKAKKRYDKRREQQWDIQLVRF